VPNWRRDTSRERTGDATTVTPPLLAVRGLCKRFNAASAPLLQGLELQLQAGQYVAIMGESGTGKSTLLNLIAGLDQPDAGSVSIDGRALEALSDDARTRVRRETMGFVFQAFHVLPHLSVCENVMLPLALLGIARAARRPRALAMLEACGIAPLAARSPRELSGGELQRTALARALVHQPRLLLLDEPTGNLDERAATQVLALVRARLERFGTAALLITHSRAAAGTADRILLLEGGRLHALADE